MPGLDHGTSTRARKRPQGHIDTLRSGSLRVYAGKDRYLTEVIEPGPAAADRAEEARLRLIDQIMSNRYAHPLPHKAGRSAADAHHRHHDGDADHDQERAEHVERDA